MPGVGRVERARAFAGEISLNMTNFINKLNKGESDQPAWAADAQRAVDDTFSASDAQVHEAAYGAAFANASAIAFPQPATMIASIFAKMRAAFPGDGCNPFSFEPYVLGISNGHWGKDDSWRILPELAADVLLPNYVEVCDRYEPTVPGVRGCPNLVPLHGWREKVALTAEETALLATIGRRKTELFTAYLAISKSNR